MNPTACLVNAMRCARMTVSNTMSLAEEIEGAVSRAPELADRLRPFIEQAYAMADVARDIERDIATVHSTTRTRP